MWTHAISESQFFYLSNERKFSHMICISFHSMTLYLIQFSVISPHYFVQHMKFDRLFHSLSFWHLLNCFDSSLLASLPYVVECVIVKAGSAKQDSSPIKTPWANVMAKSMRSIETSAQSVLLTYLPARHLRDNSTIPNTRRRWEISILFVYLCRTLTTILKTVFGETKNIYFLLQGKELYIWIPRVK